MTKFFTAATLAATLLLGLAAVDGGAEAATRGPHVAAGSAITQVHQRGYPAPYYAPPRHAHRHYAPPPPPRHHGRYVPPHRPYRAYGWR